MYWLIYFVWYPIFVFMLNIIVVNYSKPDKEWWIHQAKIIYNWQEMVLSGTQNFTLVEEPISTMINVITFIFLEVFLCFWWPELHIGCIMSNYFAISWTFSMVGMFYVEYIEDLNKCLPSAFIFQFSYLILFASLYFCTFSKS